MKIRKDFVSNSSSTSFVVAVNKDYDLASFCEDLAKSAVNKDSKYHSKTVQKMNEANAFYNLFHNELLFLGSYLVHTREDMYAKKDLPIKKNGEVIFDENDWTTNVKDIDEWQRVKNLPDDDYRKIRVKFALKDFIDENEVLHSFYDYYASGIAVDTTDSKFRDVSRDDWFEDVIESGEASEQQKKLYEEYKVARLKTIKSLCRHSRHLDDMSAHKFSISFPRTYQITKSTIKNTRDMIAAGMEVILDDWENLDKLEKRLDEGQQIFCIHNNYRGDGWDSDAIYSEDGCKLISVNNNLAMEYLNSEAY